MIILQQLGAAGRVAQKAAHMLDVDPHGWTLTLVSVCVVFLALFLLYRAYLITGKIFTGQYRRKSRGRKADEQAAAVAIAIDRYLGEGRGDEELAAIAAALHLYLEDTGIHDNESGIITIKR